MDKVSILVPLSGEDTVLAKSNCVATLYSTCALVVTATVNGVEQHTTASGGGVRMELNRRCHTHDDESPIGL